MSVKLNTYITKENKISKKQYPINVTDEINIGLLHQVVTSNRTNHRNNTASVKTRAQDQSCLHSPNQVRQMYQSLDQHQDRPLRPCFVLSCLVSFSEHQVLQQVLSPVSHHEP